MSTRFTGAASVLVACVAALTACAASGCVGTTAQVDPPEAADACSQALSRAAVARLFAHLQAIDREVPCSLASVRTDGAHTRVHWTESRAPAHIAPTACLEDPDAAGPALAIVLPTALRRTCPAASRRMAALIGEGDLGVGGLNALGADGGSPATALLARAARIALGLVWLLALLVSARGALRVRPWRRAQLQAAAPFVAFGALALATRLWVEPALANWYTEVLPPAGDGAARFGPGAFAFQAALRSWLPWSDRTLFAANAVLGGGAVVLFAALLRQLGVRWCTVTAVSVLFCLAPLHVRISASGSEQVLASTLLIGAIAAWARGTAKADAPWLGLGLCLAAAAMLTRVDMWFQLLGMPLFALFGANQPLPKRWQLGTVALFGSFWLVAGVLGFAWIVLPSAHPGPTLADIWMGAQGFFTQHASLALRGPRWVSPVAVLLALVGIAHMWLRRRRLLVAVIGFLAVAFIPTGRNLLHDELLSARYFLATIPAFLVLSGFGAEAIARGMEQRRPESARAFKLALLAALAGSTLLLAESAYKARYTFQDEYAFLRGELGALPDGCTVYYPAIRIDDFERDLDCCLDLARTPLTLAFPRLRFEPVPAARAPVDPGTACAAFYRGAACALEDRAAVRARHPVAVRVFGPLCDRAVKGRAVPLGRAEASPRSTNGLFRGPVPISLDRVYP